MERIRDVGRDAATTISSKLGKNSRALFAGKRRKEFPVNSVGDEFGLLDSRTAFDCDSEFVSARVTLGLSPRDKTFLQEPLDQSAHCGTIDPCTLHEVGLTQPFLLSNFLEYSKLPRRDVEVAGLNMEKLVRALARAVKNVEGARSVPLAPLRIGVGRPRVAWLLAFWYASVLIRTTPVSGIPVFGETSRAQQRP